MNDRQAEGRPGDGTRRRGDRPSTVLFTGLSGAGKTTLMLALAALLRSEGREVTTIDGDDLRRQAPGLGYGLEDRKANLERAADLALLANRENRTVLVALIAPQQSGRRAFKARITAGGSVPVVIHVSTPLAECERRDVKGLYLRARRGEIHDFTGLDSPYEEPDGPDLRVDTTSISVSMAVDLCRGLLRSPGAGQGAA